MGNSALIDPKSWLNPVPFLQFPLMSRSKKIHDLITNKESHEAAWRDTGGEPEEDAEEIREKEMEIEMALEEDEEADVHRIRLLEFPGRAEAFELAAKFCYCIKASRRQWRWQHRGFC